MTEISQHEKPTRSEFVLDHGVRVLVEESHELALVDIDIAFLTGSAYDPPTKLGLSRLTARVVRMGTKDLGAAAVDEKIDSLGAQLSIEISPSTTRFSGTVIKRNVEEFVGLLAELLGSPAFREADLAQVKRESIADIIDGRDDDRGLAARHFRSAVFGDAHPLGRSVIGTRASISGIALADLRNHFETHYVASSVLMGFAGDISDEEARRFAGTVVARLGKRGAPAPISISEPEIKGRHVVIVDKPERSQTQIYIGGKGTHANDSDHTALVVANTVFGGTFTARMMKEVRSVRGWSYGAHSRLGIDRTREAFSMWTFPAVTDAPSCIELELSLLETLLKDGITAEELTFAQNYLTKSYAFEIDTASKRLEQRIEIELYNLPKDYFDGYQARVRSVTLQDANAALKKRLSADDLFIVLLASASEVESAISKLPRIADIRIAPFDDD